MTEQTTPAARMAEANQYREGKSTGKQLMGMPVISISDGEQQGEIHDVVYSPAEGRLIGFTLLHGGGLFSRGDTLWLAADRLHALGEDAVTVDSPDALQPLTEDVDEVAEQAGEPVLGKRLLTDDGKFLGNVDDVLIDRETRRVVAYEVSGGLWQDMMRGQSDVPVDHIISIGAAAVIVPAFVKEQVTESSGGLVGAASAAQEKAVELKDAAAEKMAQARTETAEAIERKEADYARGKIAGRAVTDESGSVIVPEGATITEAHIQHAIALGRLHALAASAGVSHAGDVADSVKERAAQGAAAVKEKAADLSDAAQDKQGDLLVGKTTGRAVLLESGQALVPAGHVLTEADVLAARGAGKLNDLTAAVGAGTWDATKERAAEAYATVSDRVETATTDAAPAVSTPVTATSVPAATPVVVVNNPEQVVVETTAENAAVEGNGFASPARSAEAVETVVIVPPASK